MKKYLVILFLLITTNCFAKNWCDDPLTQLCITYEDSGGNPTDKSQNEFTVTNNETAISSGSAPASYSTYYGTFDGTDDNLTITDNGDLDFEGATEDFSMCAWVKPTATNTYSIYGIGDGNDDNLRFIMIDNPGDGNLWGSIDAIDVKSANSAMSGGAWAHVCFVADRDGNGQIWVNGAVSGSAIALSSEAMSLTSTTFRVGEDWQGALDMSGDMDEHLIYSGILTSEQINDIMNNGLEQSSTRKRFHIIE